MAQSNLFALNELLEKIKAGEGTAKTNLEALNALCVLSGGQGGHKTNLDALNEILTVFSPASPSQEKNLSVTENGNYEVIPDENFVLSKVAVSVDVPSLPEQAKTVTITKNGTTEILPDEGFTLSSITAEVSVASEGGEMKLAPFTTYTGGTISNYVQAVDFSKLDFSSATSFRGFFQGLQKLTEVIFPESSAIASKVSLEHFASTCTNLISLDLSSFNFLGGISSLQNFAYNSSNLISVNFGANKLAGATRMDSAFYNCSKMVSCDISAIDTRLITNVNQCFYRCSNLENLVVGENFLANASVTNFALSYSNKLTHDSLVRLLQKLATRDNAPTLVLGSTNLAKLTEEEKAIATDKGWVLS